MSVDRPARTPCGSPAKNKRRGFFALDVHQFDQINQNDLGLEEAATYLCLLAGTDQSNIASSWGVNSVMEHAGLSRAEAKKAIRNLTQCGIVECKDVARPRARSVHRYDLPIHDGRLPLSQKEKLMIEAVQAGQQPGSARDVQTLHRAKNKGWIEKRADCWCLIEHSNEVAFIPNSFVRVRQGHSPLHRLVNSGELGPIMLAAELYQLQNLMDARGVPAELIRAYFRAYRSEPIERHIIHHLELGRCYDDSDSGDEDEMSRAHHHSWRTNKFWENLEVLDAAHVTEWAVYSANGKPHATDIFAFQRPQRPLGVLIDIPQMISAL